VQVLTEQFSLSAPAVNPKDISS